MGQNLKTPLYAQHQASAAKICPFAGYAMPLHYTPGVIKEHEWVRSHAGIFDVSHMGQLLLSGKDAVAFLEKITPSGFTKAPTGRAKYTVLTNDKGGIIDDIIVTRRGEESFFIVCNAARKAVDIAWFKQHLPDSCSLLELPTQALIAIQGPDAEAVVTKIFPDANVASQPYMFLQELSWNRTPLFLSRLGYTGEDGFEISIAGDKAGALWEILLADERVLPIGLAARDSLRLEAGYPLYGHDLTEETSPVEAGLEWVIAKQSTQCIGADRIQQDLKNGVKQKRFGIQLAEKGIAREGCTLWDKEGKKIIGHLTSGGFSPILKASIGLGYVDSAFANASHEIFVEVRGKKIHARTHALPFIEVKTKSFKKA